MRPFLQKLALLLLPFCLFTGGINYLIDPGSVFHAGRIEKAMASHLLDGMNLTNIHNYDERRLQRFFTEGLKKPFSVVVLGSSRSMQIGSSVLKCDIFNSSVSGATLEDHIAIYQLYRKRGLLPKQILIGLDPWLLDSSVTDTRFLSINHSYEELIKVLQIPPPRRIAPGRFDVWIQLFSPSYLQSSLHTLVTRIEKREASSYTITNDTETSGAIRLADGTLSYDQRTRDRQPQDIERDLGVFIANRKEYSLDLRGRLPAYERLFDAFAHLVISDGVKLSFVLVPYHPSAYRLLMATSAGPRLREAESLFRSKAQELNIPLLGSYDPAPFSLHSSSFYDPVHPKAEVFLRLLELQSDVLNGPTSKKVTSH